MADAAEATVAAPDRPVTGDAAASLTTPARWATLSAWVPRLLIVSVFALAFALRLLDPEIHREHNERLVGGRQMLEYGELPFRDWLDNGFFFQHFISAALQYVFGYRYLGEALFSVFFLAAATSLTCVLAAQAARSILIGLVMAIFFFATYPHLYNHYKLFLIILGLYLCWNYVDRRTTRNLVVLALATAVAFLMRQDLAVYIGAGSLTMLAASHWRDGPVVLLRRAGLYGTTVATVLVPFFLFLQLNGGIGEYYRVVMEFSRAERGGLRWDNALSYQRRPFVIDPSAPPFAIALDPPAPPPAAARIKVRWAPAVDDRARARLEERYRLASPSPDTGDARGRTWSYGLLDASPTNVGALVREGDVEDTDGIDRRTNEVRGRGGESTWTSLQRAIPLLRLRVTSGYVRPENAGLWLYDVVVWLPPVVLVVLLLKRLVERVRSRPKSESMAFETPKILCAVVLSALATRGLLFFPDHSRLADVGVPAAVLGAWLLRQLIGDSLRWRLPRPTSRRVRPVASRARMAEVLRPLVSVVPMVPRLGAAVALLAVTWLSIVTLAGVGPRLERTQLPTLLSGPGAIAARGARVWGRIGTAPPIDQIPPNERGLPVLIRYVHDCTRPTDRVLVTSWRSEVFFLSGRAFGGGVMFFLQEHWSSRATQQYIVSKLEREPVAVVLSDVEAYDKYIVPSHGLVHRHLQANYQAIAESKFGDERRETYRVLVNPQLVPSGTYEPLSLPCFN